MFYKKFLSLLLILILSLLNLVTVNAVTKFELLNDGCGKTINPIDYKLIEPSLVERVVQLGDLLHIRFSNIGIVKQYIIFGNLLVKLRELYPKFKQNPKGDRKRNIVKVLDDIIVCKLPLIKKYIDNGSQLVSDDGSYLEDKEEDKDKIDDIETSIDNSKDTTGPVVNIVGPDVLEIEYGSVYNERGASVRDMRDTLVEVIIGGDTVDVNKLGTYNVTYTATDNSGNTTTETKVVKVIDTIGPVITLMQGSTVNVPYGVEVNLNGLVEVSDGADDNPTLTINPSTISSTDSGSHEVVYTATDDSGNSSSKSITIIIGNESN